MDLTGLLGGPPPTSSRWGIAAVDTATGEQLVGHREHDLLRSASVAKIFVLVELSAAVTRGAVDLRAPLGRAATERVLDSGLWHSMLGDTLPVGDAARLVGAVSDNWATNALIDLLGLDAVQERARRLAPGGSILHDHVRAERGADHPATLGEGCAADWAAICARVERSELAGPEEDALVRDWLGSGVDHSLALSALCLDPLVHTAVTEELQVWNKTGVDAGVRADVGVIRGSARTVAFAVLCSWEPAEASVADVVRAVRSAGDRLGRLAAGPA